MIRKSKRGGGRKTIITLEVSWDSGETIHPALWNWPALIDAGKDEDARVIKYEDADEHELI